MGLVKKRFVYGKQEKGEWSDDEGRAGEAE